MEYTRCDNCGANVPAGNFCDMCGAGIPKVCKGEDSPTIKILQVRDGDLCLTLRPDTIIGRREGDYTHLLSGFKYISGKHALISYDKNRGWSITDLGSTNGTYVNDDRLEKNIPHKFDKGDIIDLGTLLFEVV